MEALSPLEIDVGPIVRAQHGSGYRQHSTMMRFRWQPRLVKDRIKELPDAEERRLARQARRYLKGSDRTPYKKFLADHAAFLAENPEAGELQRRRRLQFIEEVGLECALWPCLFWDVKHTFTHERATAPQRRAREEHETLEEAMGLGPRPREDAGEDLPDDAGTAPHSVKRLFGALALGSLLGYDGNFPLLQFAYDLGLWTSLGSKRNLQLRVPMRIMMRGEAFSPLYWRGVHLALLDLVRQVGLPQLFFTLAPYEWSFPYHDWVLDAMAKQLRPRLYLPVAETLHIAHILTQSVKGLLLGRTGGKPPWASHVFACPGEAKLQFFLRLEYQDGTRKAASQDYHGSGRVHVHVIAFAPPGVLAKLPIADQVQAVLPDEPNLRGYVEGSQLDREGRSGHPVDAEPTRFDEAKGQWRLHHSEEAAESGLRAYVADLMEVLKCHQDFQFCGDDASLLRAYVAKYVSKFSDAASDEWLNDDASAVSLAATVLMRYKPLEPEMALQMHGARFRQWHLSTQSGGKRDFVVPCPDSAPMPREVGLYLAADWARGRVSLLDFLRKTTEEGQICGWLRKAHARAGGAAVAGDLDSFAAAYAVRGEKVVAADMVSRFNDRFFGQWLMLHTPFEQPSDFLLPEDRAARAPASYKHFAMALLCPRREAADFWGDDEKVAAELRLEAHTKDHADTVLEMIRAQRSLVGDYLSGALDAQAEAAQRAERLAACGPEAAAAAEGPAPFNREQQRALALTVSSRGSRGLGSCLRALRLPWLRGQRGGPGAGAGGCRH
ncbi:unnamed protein product [Effrenium voratum]|nr:unnamed protein product [Effrenium voratum]